MKRLMITLATIGTMAAGPAFASCGGHGSGGGYGTRFYSPAPYRSAVRKPVVARTFAAKPAPVKKPTGETGAAKVAAIEDDAKPADLATPAKAAPIKEAPIKEAPIKEAKGTSVAADIAVAAQPAADPARSRTIECKQFVPSVGLTVTVPCG